jgi:hypothetical protein
MKNRIAILFCVIFSVSAGYSQNMPLTIEGSNGKFYLIHAVVAKENWYSIGRLFNLSPHDIAGFNNMSFDKPLEVATPLNIPLNAGNFDQKPVKISGESLIPVYHMVGDNEWMFKISSTYNDVPVTSLEKWNKIKRDDIKKGMPLIVGFLKVKTDLSPLAMGISANPAPGPQTGDVSNRAAKPTDVPAQPLYKPVATNPPNISSQNPSKPVGSIVTNTANTAGAVPVTSTSEHINNYALTHSNGGFFSTDFAGGGKSAAGLAGTFKSTSGWTDGKYYALMNGLSVGTIVRVTGANSKTIYAKVLGQLPEMKESTGLLIRISNAASAELGLGEGKFPVEIKF